MEKGYIVKVSANAFLATKISFIDARYALDARLWQAAGWSVHVLGRP